MNHAFFYELMTNKWLFLTKANVYVDFLSRVSIINLLYLKVLFTALYLL
jgi:hypothetical protein